MTDDRQALIAALLPPIRSHLFTGVLAFTEAASRVPGVTRIALIGSLATDKPDPKDADLLVTVADDIDLTLLAAHGRKLLGHGQSRNRGGEIFLASTRGEYLGRTRPWKTSCGWQKRTLRSEWYHMHLLALGRRGKLPADPIVLGSTAALHELLPELESDAIDELPPDGVVVVSGYDPRIDPGLLGLLRNMHANKADVLAIASFKWLTRNPEKLYRVMDAVLLMDKSIITGNYIIARDGVMARDPLLRPPHFESEIPAMLQNTRGLTRTHREIMARVVRG